MPVSLCMYKSTPMPWLCVEVREYLVGVYSELLHVNSGAWTQIFRLGRQNPYPLSHFTRPTLSFPIELSVYGKSSYGHQYDNITNKFKLEDEDID